MENSGTPSSISDPSLWTKARDQILDRSVIRSVAIKYSGLGQRMHRSLLKWVDCTEYGGLSVESFCQHSYRWLVRGSAFALFSASDRERLSYLRRLLSLSQEQAGLLLSAVKGSNEPVTSLRTGAQTFRPRPHCRDVDSRLKITQSMEWVY